MQLYEYVFSPKRSKKFTKTIHQIVGDTTDFFLYAHKYKERGCIDEISKQKINTVIKTSDDYILYFVVSKSSNQEMLDKQASKLIKEVVDKEINIIITRHYEHLEWIKSATLKLNESPEPKL